MHYAVLADQKLICKQLLHSGASPNIQVNNVLYYHYYPIAIHLLIIDRTVKVILLFIYHYHKKKQIIVHKYYVIRMYLHIIGHYKMHLVVLYFIGSAPKDILDYYNKLQILILIKKMMIMIIIKME